MKYWSPEQVIKRLKLSVSVLSVYKAIKIDIISKGAVEQLRCGIARYKQRGKEEKRCYLLLEFSIGIETYNRE